MRVIPHKVKNNGVGDGSVHDFSFKLQSCISDWRILHMELAKFYCGGMDYILRFGVQMNCALTSGLQVNGLSFEGGRGGN